MRHYLEEDNWEEGDEEAWKDAKISISLNPQSQAIIWLSSGYLLYYTGGRHPYSEIYGKKRPLKKWIDYWIKQALA
jgi:hypothetical protein